MKKLEGFCEKDPSASPLDMVLSMQQIETADGTKFAVAMFKMVDFVPVPGTSKSSLRLPPRSPTATYNMIVDLTVSSDEEAADAGAEALSPPQARRAQPGTCERGGWSTRTKKTRWLRVGEGIGACELRVLLRAAARLRLRLRRVCGTVTATRG